MGREGGMVYDDKAPGQAGHPTLGLHYRAASGGDPRSSAAHIYVSRAYRGCTCSSLTTLRVVCAQGPWTLTVRRVKKLSG